MHACLRARLLGCLHRYVMRPNPSCSNALCVAQQKAYKQRLIDNPPPVAAAAEEAAVVHDDDVWGICVVDESAPSDDNTGECRSV